MFLFRKKKENTEIKEEAGKTEVKKAAAPPVKVVDKTVKAVKAEKPEKQSVIKTPDAGVKVRSESVSPKNPDELADSLLVKVNQDPEIEQAVDDAVVEAVLRPVAAVTAGVDEAVSASLQPAEALVVPASKVSAQSENIVSIEAPAVPAAIPDVQSKPAATVGTGAAGNAVTGVSEAATTAAASAAASAAAASATAAAAAATASAAAALTAAATAPKAAAPAETPKKEDTAKPAEDKKAAEEKKNEDNGNLFSTLFGKTEVEEETPVDRLIKMLPDISIEEVVNEADEVKNLINEWYQNPR